MTLASQGRSASALTGALSGSGTVTLESARIAGLDPRAFDVAVRASDSGKATDDVKLRQIVEPVLSAGALAVASAQIPFGIRDGRIRIGATTLDAKGSAPSSRAATIFPPTRPTSAPALPRRQQGRRQPPGNSAVRGGHARCARPHRRRRGAVVMAGGAGDRPRNPKARCDRARRAAATIAASLPPRRYRRLTGTPDAALPALPTGEVPIPGRDQRRPLQPKAKTVVRLQRRRPPRRRPPLRASPRARPSAAATIRSSVQLGQQAAPLPPPIEVRPAPGSNVVRPPKLRPPLVLTPRAAPQ